MSGFHTADLMSLEVSSAHAVGCPETMPSGCMGKQPKTVILCVFSFLEVVAVVQSLGGVQLLATPWTAACQASLFITNSWSLVKRMSIELVMPYNYLILCHPLRLLQNVLVQNVLVQ